jgi:lipopolysaccharide/colanic/teichoic acid biosynthesis glycosyltransferase
LFAKRLFDIVFSVLALAILGWALFLGYIIATADTQSNGLFRQKRIGQFAKPFTIFKLRTVHPKTGKVSAIGSFFRKYKIDELPQLLNVLFGNMTLVGPRPDIAGYYDRLEGADRKVLDLKPGITSKASLKYYNEEEILSQQQNPTAYNDQVIFPDKVKMNLDYYDHRSFWGDIRIMWSTFFDKH